MNISNTDTICAIRYRTEMGGEKLFLKLWWLLIAIMWSFAGLGNGLMADSAIVGNEDNVVLEGTVESGVVRPPIKRNVVRMPFGNIDTGGLRKEKPEIHVESSNLGSSDINKLMDANPN